MLMSLIPDFPQLAAEHPDRGPGTAGAAAVFAAIYNTVSGWNTDPQKSEAPVYRFQSSLWGFCLLGLVGLATGYFFPVASPLALLPLALLLLNEFNHPFLARFMPARSENLTLNLPAKNKETQRVFLFASFDSEAFIKCPFGLEPGLYIRLLFGLVAALAVLSLAYAFLGDPLLNHIGLLLLGVIGIFNLMSKARPRLSSLKNCAAVIEAGSILTKVKPDITTVTLCFTGSQSLNSGMVNLLPEINRGPAELTYVVNLTETAASGGNSIQLITSEGPVGRRSSAPLLISALQEVARVKSLRLATVKTEEFTETYPVNRKKIAPVTLAIPCNDAVSVREIRELLCGLIRKLDH
jgi:hypothetical protein